MEIVGTIQNEYPKKNTKPQILAITGGIATGKTNIGKLFIKWQVPLIDADKISHKLTKKDGLALPIIVKEFGKQILNLDGTLNRKFLAEIVFKSRTKKKILEKILHPLIYEKINDKIEYFKSIGAKVVVIDIPLIFETNMQHIADEIWLLYAPIEEQITRLEKRGLSKEEAKLRIKSQWSFEKKKDLAHQIIDTTGSKEQTALYVKNLFSKRFYPL